MSNDTIFETIVTTIRPGTAGAAPQVHIAPMGLRRDGRRCVLMPFRPSTTLDNILATRSAVVNFTTDVRVFAGSVTGRRDWPTRPVERVPGVRLENTLAHAELQLVEVREDAQRPVLVFDCVHEARHGTFPGFLRAQAAVLEGAVLVSRLHLLPDAKIDAEMAYLQIAVDKTAGPAEREAWGWLVEAVALHRARRGDPAGGAA